MPQSKWKNWEGFLPEESLEDNLLASLERAFPGHKRTQEQKLEALELAPNPWA